jgi:transcriptional regulator GlxA family with amidase domain
LIEPEHNVDDIGKSIGLSRVQLYRKIKSLTNYTPNELVSRNRLKEAEKLLYKTEKTIAKIAYDRGFSSPSYFTKCIKEYVNESPSERVKAL